MGKIKRFEDLEIWQKAIEIAVEIYTLSDQEKLKHDYSLKDQIQRAVMSISDNIAEGFEYDNNKDFIKFLRYSKGSAGEVRSKIYVLNKIKFIPDETYQDLYKRLTELSKQIASFIKYLREYEKTKHK